MNDAKNQNTAYAYDAASRLTSKSYPHGWDETYEYDAAGQLLTQFAADPTNSPNKSVTHEYTYDPNGNVLTEYDTGVAEQECVSLTHLYDELNRLTKTTEQGCNQRTYTYDSLGNLVKEKYDGDVTEYWYNELNQQIKELRDDYDTYVSTFDGRGNLTKTQFKKSQSSYKTTETYVYDSTNRMVRGTNEDGEETHYVYNGLGHLIANEKITEKDSCGYTCFNSPASPQKNGVVVFDRQPGFVALAAINPTGKGHTSGSTTGAYAPSINSHNEQVIHREFTLDYLSPLTDVIMEKETGSGGLSYRNDKVKMWYHRDRLGVFEDCLSCQGDGYLSGAFA